MSVDGSREGAHLVSSWKEPLTREEVDRIVAIYYHQNYEYQRFQRMTEQAKAFWLGFHTVEEMRDHLPWLDTRFPEGAEL